MIANNLNAFGRFFDGGETHGLRTQAAEERELRDHVRGLRGGGGDAEAQSGQARQEGGEERGKGE